MLFQNIDCKPICHFYTCILKQNSKGSWPKIVTFLILSFIHGDTCFTVHPFWSAAGEKDGVFKLQITWLPKVITKIKKSFARGVENLNNIKN